MREITCALVFAFLSWRPILAEPIPAPSPSPINVPFGLVVKAEPPSETVHDAQQDFERATGLLDKGEETMALVSFTDFLRRYPQHNLAADAQFNIGEIYFRQRKYLESIEEFSKVRNFTEAKGRRDADAVLRTGECFQKLGQNDKAKIEWNALIRKYPKSPAALKAHSLLKGLP